MLLLSRNRGEVLVIEIPETKEQLKIMYTGRKGDQIKLGVDCPRHWKVYRGEQLGIVGEKDPDRHNR